MAATAKNIEQALLVAPILFAAGAGLVVMTGNIFIFLFDAAVAYAAYALGYKNFKDGKMKEAKAGALVMAIVAGAFFLLAATQGSPIFLMLNAIAGARLDTLRPRPAFQQCRRRPDAVGITSA